MYRQLNITDPDSSPLHPVHVSTYIRECPNSGDLSLTTDRRQATDFDKLSKADFAKERLSSLVKRNGVKRYLLPARPSKDAFTEMVETLAA